MSTIDTFAGRSSPTFVSALKPEADYKAYEPNRKPRPIKSGHFVPVRPNPLPSPKLVSVSQAMCEELELSPEECREDQRFIRWASGDVDALPGLSSVTWATPYALSIYGNEMTNNCPFGTGEGYGDGRAFSIAEVLVNGKRWEVQLKGGGQTPFCRGGDGRAVLRSSVREFLVSEAMKALRVETTRALSLVTSQSETVRRAWYSGKQHAPADVTLHPEFKSLPPEYQKVLVEQTLTRAKEPDIVVHEPTAITARVSPSFIRVGHVELFSRRTRTGDEDKLKDLEAFVQHLFEREFPEVEGDTFQDRILAMLVESSKRIATLTADWVRVGFVQGNFNSDNCLVAGRTMDYGPFGFIEQFEPLWNMWVGGGSHYGFLNQPAAGSKNFTSLVNAVSPLLDPANRLKALEISDLHEDYAIHLVSVIWMQKLGLSEWTESSASLMGELLGLMESTKADYTLFWRNLSYIPEKYTSTSEVSHTMLGDVFYCTLSKEQALNWDTWLSRWISLLGVDVSMNGLEISTAMKLVNPKFVPREWMLVVAYTAAKAGDYSALEEMAQVFKSPYTEQSSCISSKYFTKSPSTAADGIGIGGTSFMT